MAWLADRPPIFGLPVQTLTKQKEQIDLGVIQRLVAGDMKAVNHLVQARLASDVVLINQLGAYIINSGGKRLRPLLVLLSSRACGYQGEHHHLLAAIVEFIHTATLLHDDVVDGSELRRGRQTANALWGNSASVLVGDFLYSRAFQMMVEVNSMRVMEILSDATNTIAEGEVMQLLNCNDPDTTQECYLQVIRSKTAKLFEAAAQLGAVLTSRPAAEEQGLARYGMHLGTAFQLVDDVLDYRASADEMGKNLGDDLAEGKPTLPLIHAMRVGTPAQRTLIRNAIENGGRDGIAEILEAVESTGALEFTAQMARAEADHAIRELSSLPGGPYKDALITLADFSVERRY